MSDDMNMMEAGAIMLESLLDEESVEAIKEATDEDIAAMHFGFGSWIRNDLGLWTESPLRDYLEEHGIKEPDDMSAALIYVLRAYLRGEDCEKVFDRFRRKE